jgi:hypothetical protein
VKEKGRVLDQRTISRWPAEGWRPLYRGYVSVRSERQKAQVPIIRAVLRTPKMTEFRPTSRVASSPKVTNVRLWHDPAYVLASTFARPTAEGVWGISDPERSLTPLEPPVSVPPDARCCSRPRTQRLPRARQMSLGAKGQIRLSCDYRSLDRNKC